MTIYPNANYEAFNAAIKPKTRLIDMDENGA